MGKILGIVFLDSLSGIVSRRLVFCKHCDVAVSRHFDFLDDYHIIHMAANMYRFL